MHARCVPSTSICSLVDPQLRERFWPWSHQLFIKASGGGSTSASSQLSSGGTQLKRSQNPCDVAGTKMFVFTRLSLARVALDLPFLGYAANAVLLPKSVIHQQPSPSQCIWMAHTVLPLYFVQHQHLFSVNRSAHTRSEELTPLPGGQCRARKKLHSTDGASLDPRVSAIAKRRFVVFIHKHVFLNETAPSSPAYFGFCPLIQSHSLLAIKEAHSDAEKVS